MLPLVPALELSHTEPSTRESGVFKISRIRLPETLPRGIIVKIIDREVKPIMMYIESWVKVFIMAIEPGFSPNKRPIPQTIARDVPCIINESAGSTALIIILVNRSNFEYSLLVFSNFSSCLPSLPFALTTLTPVKLSRVTRLSLSVAFWIFLNLGITVKIITKTTIIIASTENKLINASLPTPY